ncbi:MAG: hypothetical protein AAGU19_08525 [Prolixibacteraceae bacterium]
MKLKRIYIGLLCMLAIACGKSEKELASGKLLLAESLYQKGDTVGALAQADSIGILYRGALQEINAASQLKRKIYGDLLYRRQDELDTLEKTISVLENNFLSEKNDFDRHVSYVHKKQDPERRWNKSFIQVHPDGKGNLSISSNYYGDTWLDHTGIRVYDGDLQAKTDTVALTSVLNHHSEFLKTKWEKVTYVGDAGRQVIDFIASHSDRKLKAVFLGKRHYYIILEEYDKQAIIDGLNLSAALKRRIVLQKEITELQSKAG